MPQRNTKQYDIANARNSVRGGWSYEPSTLEGRRAKEIAQLEKNNMDSMFKWAYTPSTFGGEGQGSSLSVLGGAILIGLCLGGLLIYQYFVELPWSAKPLMTAIFKLLGGILAGAAIAGIFVKVFRFNHNAWLFLWLIFSLLGILAVFIWL